MDEWHFSEARAAMTLAGSFLADAQRLQSRTRAAGLSPPARLAQRYAQAGGGPASQEELRAEGVVVDAYVHATRLASQPRSLTERLGLAGRDPDQLLASAGAQFAAGDLQSAAGNIAEAERRLASAGSLGITRLIVVGLIGLSGLIGLLQLWRRRVGRGALR
jgi:hypothetical protein